MMMTSARSRLMASASWDRWGALLRTGRSKGRTLACGSWLHHPFSGSDRSALL